MKNKERECLLYAFPEQSCYDYPEQCINCVQRNKSIMSKEDQELLFKDLSSRLLYKVKGYDKKLKRDGLIDSCFNSENGLSAALTYSDKSVRVTNVEDIQPYLKPFRLTEKEIKELNKIDSKRYIFSARHLTYYLDGEIIEYFDSHYLDWRGLIPKGLAKEAPEGMYKI